MPQRYRGSDGDCRGMEQLADVRSDERGAQDDAAVGVDHHHSSALIAVGDYRAAGDGSEIAVDRSHRVPGTLRLRFGDSDRGDLRIAKHDLRDRPGRPGLFSTVVFSSRTGRDRLGLAPEQAKA